MRYSGIVGQFLASHPDYYIQIAGHSLGAGTSAILALIMKDDFPVIIRSFFIRYCSSLPLTRSLQMCVCFYT
jgi:hypothetical protein